MTWWYRLLLWWARHRPVILTADRLSDLRFRAMWHCPTCTEASVHEHDRNRYGGRAVPAIPARLYARV